MLPLADLRIAFDTDTLFDFGDGKSARACEVSAKVHKRKDIANATCKSIANAIETSAIVISMKPEALSMWRRDRLKALSAKFGGNAGFFTPAVQKFDKYQFLADFRQFE